MRTFSSSDPLMKKLSSTGLNWMQVTAKSLIAEKQINCQDGPKLKQLVLRNKQECTFIFKKKEEAATYG